MLLILLFANILVLLPLLFWASRGFLSIVTQKQCWLWVGLLVNYWHYIACKGKAAAAFTSLSIPVQFYLFCKKRNLLELPSHMKVLWLWSSYLLASLYNWHVSFWLFKDLVSINRIWQGSWSTDWLPGMISSWTNDRQETCYPEYE